MRRGGGVSVVRRILATHRPTVIDLPLEPMSADDLAFWRGRERAAAEARQRREARGR